MMSLRSTNWALTQPREVIVNLLHIGSRTAAPGRSQRVGTPWRSVLAWALINALSVMLILSKDVSCSVRIILGLG